MNPPGKILQEGERASIQFQRLLPYTADQIWSALTNPDELALWFGKVLLEGRAGGSITVEAGPEHVPIEVRRSIGRILVWDPPHVLEYEWRQSIVEPSSVRFELETRGDDTLLRFTHCWLGLRNASGFAPGWHAFLDRLEAVLDKSALPDWQIRYGEVRSTYGWK